MPLYALDDARPHVPGPDLCWVAPDATVIGKVKLERDASIWFKAVVRGDRELILIGERSNVQDGSVLHTDMGYPLVIGAGCTVGHRAILHGCIIGDNSLIGMGATLLNGAKIGRNCIIGAGALVSEGKEIPDNSLVVGVPGRVVRTLDAASAETLKASAESYVQNWKRFRSGLSRID